jgi:hypothetical protein
MVGFLAAFLDWGWLWWIIGLFGYFIIVIGRDD